MMEIRSRLPTLTLRVITWPCRMVQSFSCRETECLFTKRTPRRLPQDLVKTALRKLGQLHAVSAPGQLNVPPGNRLEALKGGLRGWHSIRLNDPWRLCFRWQPDGHHEVIMAAATDCILRSHI